MICTCRQRSEQPHKLTTKRGKSYHSEDPWCSYVRERESSADGGKNLPPVTGGQNKVVDAEERSGVRVGGGDGGGGVCHLEEPDGG
jgi:hypothetical protein